MHKEIFEEVDQNKDGKLAKDELRNHISHVRDRMGVNYGRPGPPGRDGRPRQPGKGKAPGRRPGPGERQKDAQYPDPGERPVPTSPMHNYTP